MQSSFGIVLIYNGHDESIHSISNFEILEKSLSIFVKK